MSDAGLRTLALVRHNAVLTLREPGPLVSRLVMPVVLLSVLHPLYSAALSGSGGGTVQSATGMMVMFSMLAVSIVGITILNERLFHTWNRLRATPAQAAEILVAKSVSACGVLLVQQATVLVFAVAVFGLQVPAPGLLAGAVLIWCVTLLCCGALLGTLVSSSGALSAVQDVAGLLFTAVGGALVPLSVLPGWVRDIAPISPGYWGVSMLQAALRGAAGATVRDGGVLLAIAVVAGALACRRLTSGQQTRS